MQDDLKELECSICIDVKDGEIHQCHESHIYCVECWQTLQSYVPSARVCGLKHGKGTYTVADGRKYVGGYKDDERHGFGTEFFPNGTIYFQGEWANGEPVHGPDLS